MEHIAKNVLRTRKGFNQVVKEVAKKYTMYVKSLLDQGYKVIVIGVNISGYAKNSYGNMVERGKISEELNSRIKKRLSEEKNAYYADISHITSPKLWCFGSNLICSCCLFQIFLGTHVRTA